MRLADCKAIRIFLRGGVRNSGGLYFEVEGRQEEVQKEQKWSGNLKVDTNPIIIDIIYI